MQSKNKIFFLVFQLMLLIVLITTNNNQLTINYVDNSNNRENLYQTKILENFEIKVMTYNVEHGGGDLPNPEWMQVVKAENPDIIICVETEDWHLDDKLNGIVTELNDYFVPLGEYPYFGSTEPNVPYDGSGVGILCRFNMLSVDYFSAVQLDNDDLYAVSHSFIDALVDIGGNQVHIIGAHLKAMEGATNEEKRERATEGILNYMDNLGDVPIMYMGDMNSFSPEDIGINTLQSGLGYGPITMIVDPSDITYGQYSSEVHNITDVYRELNPSSLGITSYDWNSRIDFIFVNQLLENNITTSSIVTGTTAQAASDHYPVFVNLSMTGEINITTSTTTTSTEGNDGVFITEINASPNGNYLLEYVELYNTYDSVVNISNWVLVQHDSDRSTTFPEGTIIPANGFLVVCRDKSEFDDYYTPSYLTILGDIALNGAEWFELQDSSAFLVDQALSADTGIGATQCLERISVPNDNGSLISAWSDLGDNQVGNPGSIGGTIVISEFSIIPLYFGIFILSAIFLIRKKRK